MKSQKQLISEYRQINIKGALDDGDIMTLMAMYGEQILERLGKHEGKSGDHYTLQADSSGTVKITIRPIIYNALWLLPLIGVNAFMWAASSAQDMTISVFALYIFCEWSYDRPMWFNNIAWVSFAYWAINLLFSLDN